MYPEPIMGMYIAPTAARNPNLPNHCWYTIAGYSSNIASPTDIAGPVLRGASSANTEVGKLNIMRMIQDANITFDFMGHLAVEDMTIGRLCVLT
jgi:hypothetical protein